MRGKDINITMTAGAESIREIKVIGENGEVYPMENIGVIGKLWDMRMEREEGELECKVTENGIIEVRFPAKGVGRYIFAVDGVSDDGSKERIIEGYVGYEGPRMEEIGEGERVEMLVYIDGDRRRALFGRNLAWVSMYKESQEVAEQVKEVDKKLEKAEALDKAFSEKMSDFIKPNPETETWEVAGVDTGISYKGADGKNADSIMRYVIESESQLPPIGDTAAYYYVKREAQKANGFLFLQNSPGPEGEFVININGWNFYCPADMTAASIAAEINRQQNYVTATVDSDDDRLILFEAKLAGDIGNSITLNIGENKNNQQLSGPTLTGGVDEGYVPYVWLKEGNKGSWKAVLTTAEKIEANRATVFNYGTVMLANKVSTAESWKVPSNDAVYKHVSSELQNKVNKEELSSYATKDEISTLATKQEIEGLATKEELEEISVQVPQNVVSSTFGKKIVELSETEYSLLESYDEDTYYFTFAD